MIPLPRLKHAAGNHSFDLLIALALAVMFFIMHLLYLMKSPVPDGSDAYVYLVQARSLVEKGSLHYPDFSIIHPVMALFYLVIRDPVISYKACCAFLCGISAGAFYLSAMVLSGKRLTAVAVALFFVSGPVTGFFACQFPKQFLGMIFVLMLAGSLESGRAVLTIVFLILAYLSHRTGSVCGVVLLLAYPVLRRYNARKILWTCCGIAAAALIISFIPGTLSIADCGRFAGTISSGPALAPLGFMNIFGKAGMHPLLRADAIIRYCCCAGGMMYFLLSISKKPPIQAWYGALCLLLAVLLFPWFVMDGESMGYRLFLSAMFIAPLCVVPLFDKTDVKILLPAVLLFIAAGMVYVISDNTTRYSPPYDLYRKTINSVERNLRSKKDVELVVVHRPLAEMIDFYLRRDALAWKPEKRFDRKRTWRIAYNIEPWEIEGYLEKNNDGFAGNEITVLSPMYIMLREDVWDKFTASVQPEDEISRRIYSEMNPFRERPFFITKGRE